MSFHRFESELSIVLGAVLTAGLLVSALTSVGPARAQPRSVSSPTEDSDVIGISMAPVYQQYTINDQSVYQSSLRLSVSASLTERLGTYVQGQVASGGGDELERVDGIDDTRLGLRYDRSLGAASVRLRLDATLPSGTRSLSSQDLSTVSLLSENYFDFRVPSFGQGTNVFPSASVTVSLTDDVVVGLSGTFQYRGSYEPLEGMTNELEPGNGVTVGGGLDVRLTPTSAVSADVSFTGYGTDTVGGVERFEAGRRIAGTLQYLNRFGFSQIRILAQYQDRESSRLFFSPGLSGRATNVFPRQGLVEASFRTRLVDRLDGAIRLRGLLFRETNRYDRHAAGEVTVRPEYQLRESVVLGGHFAYTAGGVSGFEGGLRVGVRF